MDLSVCYRSPSDNIMTPKGRMSYAQYTMESQENDNGKAMYQCTLLFPPDSDFSMLKKEMGGIALTNCDGDKEQAKKHVLRRFIDPMNKPGGGKPEDEQFEGWTMIRASSIYRPDFIGPNGKEIPFDQVKQEQLVYSGRWARMTLNPYWFVVKAKGGGIKNQGITVGLQNIQLLDHDENIGGSKPKGEGEFEDTGISSNDGSGGYSGGDDADADDDNLFD